MSLPAMTFASAERAGWGEVGGWVYQKGHLLVLLWKCLGWLWVCHCCPPMHEWVG